MLQLQRCISISKVSLSLTVKEYFVMMVSQNQEKSNCMAANCVKLATNVNEKKGSTEKPILRQSKRTKPAKTVWLLAYAVLFWITFDAYKQVSGTVYPIKEPAKWFNATIKDVGCLSYTLQTMDRYSLRSEIECYHFRPTSVIKKKGYACKKIIYITKCISAFFGQNTIEHETRHVSSSHSECQDTYLERRRGNMDIPVFPEQQCSWFSTSETLNKFITLVSYETDWDPISREAFDPLLEGDRCDGSVCALKNRAGWWIPSMDIPDVCRFSTPVKVREYTAIGQAVTIQLHLYEKAVDIFNLCKINVCGKETIFYKSWGAVICPNKVPESFGNVTRECDRDLLYMSLEEQEVMDSVSLSKKVFNYEKCLVSIDSMKRTGTVGRMELSGLVRTTPGRGRVYKIGSSDQLLYGWTEYNDISLYKNITVQNGIIGVKDGQQIT